MSPNPFEREDVLVRVLDMIEAADDSQLRFVLDALEEPTEEPCGTPGCTHLDCVRAAAVHLEEVCDEYD